MTGGKVSALVWRGFGDVRHAQGYWPGWRYELHNSGPAHWDAWFYDRDEPYLLGDGSFNAARAAVIAHHNGGGW